MQQDIVAAIRKELEQQADDRTKGNSQSFFKERVTFYGVRTAVVNQIARQSFQQIKQLDKEAIFSLAEELMMSDYNEDAFIAFEWIYRLRSQYQPDDFNRLEKWIDQYVNNWAKCDTLCNHAVGAFIVQYPEFLPELKRWAKSGNRWLRRAATVSLIIPARKGSFLNEVFELADILLMDQDDLVQKGYGWLLKEASKLHQQEVFDYIIRNQSVMPRTALRYAIEKMPEDMRRKAMAKPPLA
jgi:3-methyladenine DNA glycosylase AlkD